MHNGTVVMFTYHFRTSTNLKEKTERIKNIYITILHQATNRCVCMCLCVNELLFKFFALCLPHHNPYIHTITVFVGCSFLCGSLSRCNARWRSCATTFGHHTRQNRTPNNGLTNMHSWHCLFFGLFARVAVFGARFQKWVIYVISL